MSTRRDIIFTHRAQQLSFIYNFWKSRPRKPPDKAVAWIHILNQVHVTKSDRKGETAAKARQHGCSFGNQKATFDLHLVRRLNLTLLRVCMCVHGKPIMSSREGKIASAINLSHENYSMISQVGYSTATATLEGTTTRNLSFCIRYRIKCATMNNLKLKSARKAKRHMRQGETTAIHGIQVLDGQFIIFLSACPSFSYLASIISSTANSINCDISSLGYDQMISLSLALVCEGVHHKLKTWNGDFRLQTTTTNYENMLSKAHISTKQGHEILSIPRECDQTWSNWQFKYIAGFLSIESR